MSVPPKGAGARGTLPLAIGLALPSPYASRHAEREDRATARPPALGPRALPQASELPEMPAWENVDGRDTEPDAERAAVEPYRSAQGPGDGALAPRAPALRAPVRLRGRRRADGARLTALGAVAVVCGALALCAVVSAQSEIELPQAPTSLPASAPEPAPPPAPTSNSASAPTSPALAASAARVRRPAASPRTAPVIVPKSDIVEPWR